MMTSAKRYLLVFHHNFTNAVTLYITPEIRSKLVFAKKTGDLPAAVGVSLFLEKFVGCIEDVKDLVAAGRGEVSQVVTGQC